MMYAVVPYFDVWYVVDPSGNQWSGPYDDKAEALSDANSFNSTK